MPIRLILISAPAIAAAAILGAASPANADSIHFIQYLNEHGENTSTEEIRLDSIDLGNAICGLLDANHDPNATVDYLVREGHTNANANMWMAGSVAYLCPELNYLTHYPTNQ